MQPVGHYFPPARGKSQNVVPELGLKNGIKVVLLCTTSNLCNSPICQKNVTYLVILVYVKRHNVSVIQEFSLVGSSGHVRENPEM